MFHWVEYRLQAKGLKIELTLVPSLPIKPRKYSAGKYVWHYFWKHRNRRSEVFCKEGVLRNFTNSTGKRLRQSLLFWDKNSLNVDAQAFSCEFCKISKNTFLHRTPLVAASENTKGIYAEATVQKVLQTRCSEKFRRINEKTFSRISFFDKLKLCGSAASFKTRP